MSKRYFLNTVVDNLTMTETLDHIATKIDQNEKLNHVVVNASKIVAMQTDLELRESVNTCDIINADGQAVVWASKILGKPLKERVAGIDLMFCIFSFTWLILVFSTFLSNPSSVISISFIRVAFSFNETFILVFSSKFIDFSIVFNPINEYNISYFPFGRVIE